MEWALALSHPDQIKNIEDPWNGIPFLRSNLQKLFEKYFGNIQFTRLYFGQEFCEKLIASQSDLKKIVEKTLERKLDLTLVTAYVTEEGLEKTKDLLEYIAKLGIECEVVVNDWGVLHMVQNFPQLKPVLGRLLNKIPRDPRIRRKKTDAPEKNETLMNCSLFTPQMKTLLKRYKVSRIELDYPPYGWDQDVGTWGYDVSVYLPYGYIATGRICLIGSWGLKPEDNFTASGPCSGLCRKHYIEMTEFNTDDSPDIHILNKGNTIFYLLEKYLEAAVDNISRSQVSRIIYQNMPL